MAGNKVLIKRSNETDTSGVVKAPSTEELVHGEIAMNYHAGTEKLFIKNDNDEIISFATERTLSSQIASVDAKATNALSNSSTVAQLAANAETAANNALYYVQRIPLTRGDGTASARQAGESTDSHPIAIGARATAWNKLTTALGDNSHSEGGSSKIAPTGITSGSTNESIKTSWESSKFLLAKGQNSHAEGNNTLSLGNHSHAEGNQNIAEGGQSHAEGYQTKAIGTSSHAECRQTTASGTNSHAEGSGTTASGTNSHAEGLSTIASGHTSHAEGSGTTASGQFSHAEGCGTVASGYVAHTEGTGTTASGQFSHAEGCGTIARSDYDHAEGFQTTAYSDSGGAAHAEGISTNALFDGAHAEGRETTASSQSSHAEGYRTTASGDSSHAEGLGTVTTGTAEHAEGRYNKSNHLNASVGGSGNTISSIGIGLGEDSGRKNAFEVMENGDIYIYGLGGYDGTNAAQTGIKTLQQILSSLN